MSAWAGSTRKETLPPDWPARVARTRKRAATPEHPRGQCEKRIRSARTGRWMRCPLPGAEVDHRRDRLDHDDLQLLCQRHHDQKTQKEARDGRAAKQAVGRRAPEPHPGLRGRRP